MDTDTKPWYERPMDSRAPYGGELGIDGKAYRGGEFLPFYVPRPEMPQIDDADYPKLFKFLKRYGIKFKQGKAKPQTLRAHQRIDKFRARQMPDYVRNIPVLISQDRYVLDGNHRWEAHVVAGTEVLYWQIRLEFEAAVDMLFRFPECQTSSTERYADEKTA